MAKNRTSRVRKDTSAKKRIAKKAKPKPGVGVYLNLPHESLNELYLLYWAEELMKRGYIESVQRADSYILTTGFTNLYTELLKKGTSNRTKEQVILRPSLYTPDYKIYWNKKGYDRFVWLVGSNTKFDKLLVGHKDEEGRIYTVLEVKPSSAFDAQSSVRIFVNNQKFLWTVHKVFANLMKPNEFFERSFTPRLFCKTSTGRPRKITFPIKTLDQFLNQ